MKRNLDLYIKLNQTIALDKMYKKLLGVGFLFAINQPQHPLLGATASLAPGGPWGRPYPTLMPDDCNYI